MKAFYKNLKVELKICMVAGYTQLICTKLQNKKKLDSTKNKKGTKDQFIIAWTGLTKCACRIYLNTIFIRRDPK